MTMYWPALLLLAASASAQPTAMTSVAPELRECYENTLFLDRNNLPPTTVSTLIDIIQRIEDNPNNSNLDMRQLAVLLLHTYRQDGIQFHEQDVKSGANILPYSPTFHSFHRHRLLVTRIVQSTAGIQSMPNDTIPAPLKCALHHMLSTTVDARVRSDESSCNQLAQYRVWRNVRSVSEDVEILDPALMSRADENGQIKDYNPNDDVESYGVENALGFSERQLLGNSQCPIIEGVVHTMWGAVSAGNLIAGIAAGAQPQQVPVLELTKGSTINHPNVPQTVNSIYPATLSGDLAEAALIQGTERGSTTTIQIGVAGGWNSTQARRYHMLQLRTRSNIEMTDAEIRGDVDGFVLGSLIQSALNIQSGLKLSQVLDMYYSPTNGLFDPNVRACNRRALAGSYINMDTLTQETYGFAAALDSNLPLPGTLTGGLDTLVTSAVTNFNTYMTTSLNDLNCVTTENTRRDFRLATNLYIVIDGSWQYRAVYPAISLLLDSIEVGKFGSSVTLLSAADGSVVVNKTFSLAEFHSNYIEARHQTILNSVNLETTLMNLRDLVKSELDHEKSIGYVGGNSTVALFILQQVQYNEAIWSQARTLNDTVPDLRLLFATSTNQFDNLWPLVRDIHNDIITVPLTATDTNVASTMWRVVERVQQVGRRIVNPTCGATFVNELSGTRQFDEFVEPGYVNFYSLSANYFFRSTSENARVRISRTSGTGSLIVCNSRNIPQPRQNSSSLDANDVVCQTISTSGEVEIKLQNACAGFTTINTCPPLYISVQSVAVAGSTSNAICTDRRCRFPYNIRYQIQINDLGCWSGASVLSASLLVLITSFVIAFFN